MSICEWSDICDKYNEGIVLGNGSSIAISKNFDYESLFDIAKDKRLMTDNIKKLFKKFKTKDYEYIMRILWYANNVRDALGLESTSFQQVVEEEYEKLRGTLIEAVKKVHPDQKEVLPNLEKAGIFLKRFKRVASLNYDLLVYWAMMNQNNKCENRLKDCFVDGYLDYDLEKLEKPYNNCDGATLIFYPHGNLVLNTDLVGKETKINKTGGDNIIQAITKKWETRQCFPLFVSEGTSEQKMEAIKRSEYLTYVYQGILNNMGTNIVLFGWSLSDQDDHILKSIIRNERLKNIAISIHCMDDENMEEKAGMLKGKITRIKRVIGCKTQFNYDFFKSESPGCWIY